MSKGHHRRTSSLLPSLNSLGSFLATAGGLNGSSAANDTTDAELMILHPTPTEWADEVSPSSSRNLSSGSNDAEESEPPARSLSQEVRFRGKPTRSFIAFPSGSDASPSASSSASLSSSMSTETPATSVGNSPAWAPKQVSLHTPPAPSSPSPSPSPMSRQASTSRSSASTLTPPENAVHARTTSLSAASRLDAALCSDENTVQRRAGLRARSINSIRGLAAAWVPARFAPSQPNSSAASSCSSNEDKQSADGAQSWLNEGRLVFPTQGANANDSKRPVKLDRRRLDKAVSLAVEAAQAAEEDERVWEQKRAIKSRSSGEEDSRQLTRTSFSPSSTSASASSAESSDDEDDSGFSLDLYISSLGYLISALSDKDAANLGGKQRADIKQRLEEGMCKLGFDPKTELAQAQAIKQQLELERSKLELAAAQAKGEPATIVHHHYHQAVGGGGGRVFGEGNFERAHAAARASGRKGNGGLAGKIGSTMVDVGLLLGAGALGVVSANLAAITSRRGWESEGQSANQSDDKTEAKITEIPTDESRTTVWQPNANANANSNAVIGSNKQWELGTAFACAAASALASSLGAVAQSDAQDGDASAAEDRLILLSAELARALKRSPLPSQVYALLGQVVSILGAIDAKYSITQKGTQLAVRETRRAMRFVRRHELHIKAVRVAWAAAEAAVAALEAYRDEKPWDGKVHQQQPHRALVEPAPENDKVNEKKEATV